MALELRTAVRNCKSLKLLEKTGGKQGKNFTLVPRIYCALYKYLYRVKIYGIMVKFT